MGIGSINRINKTMTDQEKAIYLSYLNIRQSISILLLKLVSVDVLSAFFIIISYFALIQGRELLGFDLTNIPSFVIIFGILGTLKILTTSYIVLLWLNEYYEITPEAIIHKSGIIFKKEEKYSLNNVRAMNISENFIGEILNCGTITIYDMYMREYLSLYLIHNPVRYIRVLETLKPNIEIKKQETIVPLVKPTEVR